MGAGLDVSSLHTFLSPAVTSVHSTACALARPVILASHSLVPPKYTMLPPTTRLCSSHLLCMRFSCPLSLPNDLHLVLQIPAQPSHPHEALLISPPLQLIRISSFGISSHQTVFPCLLILISSYNLTLICITNV